MDTFSRTDIHCLEQGADLTNVLDREITCMPSHFL